MAEQALAAQPTFIRTPLFLRKLRTEIPDTVPMLPVIKSPADFSHLPGAIYAVRLNESYTDVAALLLGERWYVVTAVKRAHQVMLIECADRDPLLLLYGFEAVERALVDVQKRVTWISLPSTGEDLPLELQPAAMGTFVFKSLTGTLPPDHPAYQKDVNKYKKYACVPFSVESTFFCTVFCTVFRRNLPAYFQP